MPQLPALDLLVVLFYLTGIVAFGCWFARKSGSPDGFMAASRSLPGWAVGLSIFGTFVSSISFLANPGKAFEDNWNPFVFSLSLPIAALVATKFYVPFYRKEGNISAYGHLEARFGGWARTYSVICYLLTQLARMGTILYLVALALSPLTGWDVRHIIVGTGALVILYTLLGGIEAVIWTDVLQSLVLSVGMLAAVVVIFLGMPEGPTQVFTIAEEHSKFSWGSYSMNFAEPTVWVVLLYGLCINMQNFGIDQSYVQRYITSKSDRDAVKSVWLGSLLYVPISALLFFIGTALFAFYQTRPDALQDITKADAVFPFFIVNELPAGVTGLLIAAIMAAAMSSVDSSLNSSATLMLCDVYQRYLRPRTSDRESMTVLYSTTILFGILGTLAALLMIQVKSALDAWWQLAAIFSGGMLGLFLLGRFVPRAGRASGIWGVTCGVIVILWMTFSTSSWWMQPANLSAWPIMYHDLLQIYNANSEMIRRYTTNPFHPLMTIVAGTICVLLAGLIVSFLRPRVVEKSLQNH